jgi:hypothetical protein
MADPVTDALAGAKKTLANATKFTQSVEGNPTSTFAPKKPEKPRIPQAHESTSPSYSLASKMRKAASEATAPAADLTDQASSTAAGLNERMRMQSEAQKSLQ